MLSYSNYSISGVNWSQLDAVKCSARHIDDEMNIDEQEHIGKGTTYSLFKIRKNIPAMS